MTVCVQWGYSHEIRKHDAIFERTGHPDQVQGILIHAHLPRQARCIVAAQEGPTVGVDADAKISHPYFELGPSDNVGDGSGDARVDLSGVEVGRVVLVVEGDKEDARDQG